MNQIVNFKNKRVFFVSDLHIHHGNIMKYCHRTYFMNSSERDIMNSGDERKINDLRISKESITHMDDALILNLNNKVGQDDTLWILGDFGWFKNFGDMKAIRNRINCRNIYYVMGNHDNYNFLKKCMTEVFDQIGIEVHGQHMFLNHYPMVRWDRSHFGSWQLFGHQHGNMNWWIKEHMPEAKMLDVGVDEHAYHPWSFDEVKAYMDTKKGEGIIKSRGS